MNPSVERLPAFDAPAALLGRIPAAVLLTLATGIIGGITGTLFRHDLAAITGHAGFDVGAIRTGQVWRLLTGTFVQDNPGGWWQQVFLVFLAAGSLELLAGTWMTFAAFFLADWVSTLFATLSLWALGEAGYQAAWRLARAPSVGTSAATYACLAAAFVVLGGRLGTILVVGLAAFLIAAMWFVRLDAGITHLLAAALGAVFARAIILRHPRPSRNHLAPR